MKTLIENILDLAKLKGADYADIRIVRRRIEEIEVKNGNVEALTHDEDLGFGIRILSDGAWGFACSSKVKKREMEAVVTKALKIAKASSKAKGTGILLGRPPRVDRYKTRLGSTRLTFLLKRNSIFFLPAMRGYAGTRGSRSPKPSWAPTKPRKPLPPQTDLISSRRSWNAVQAFRPRRSKPGRFRSDPTPILLGEILGPGF